MSITAASDVPLVLIGAGGHAKVLRALAMAAGRTIAGICDPQLASQSAMEWCGVPILGGDEVLEHIDPTSIGLINGIGQLVGSVTRERIYRRLRQAGFSFPPMVHVCAWVAPGVKVADGAQIMAGAIVQPNCTIGENSIINTRASVDHDCSIGDHVHIAPGATICGGVHVADGAFVGAGAVLIPGLNIGKGVIVGAGVTLTRNVAAGVARHPLPPY